MWKCAKGILCLFFSFSLHLCPPFHSHMVSGGTPVVHVFQWLNIQAVICNNDTSLVFIISNDMYGSWRMCAVGGGRDHQWTDLHNETFQHTNADAFFFLLSFFLLFCSPLFHFSFIHFLISFFFFFVFLFLFFHRFSLCIHATFLLSF